MREAEIEKSLSLNIRQIEATRRTEVQTAEQRKEIEIAQQDSQIAIANKSREQSEADAAANKARAEAVKAEELVKTSRDVTAAEREKAIQLIDASKEAEREGIGWSRQLRRRMPPSIARKPSVWKPRQEGCRPGGSGRQAGDK